MNLPDKYAAC